MKYYWVSDEIFQMKYYLSEIFIKTFKLLFRIFYFLKTLVTKLCCAKFSFRESILVMLGTFQKAFSQTATSKMCNFPASTSQVCPSRSAQSYSL